MHSVGFYKKSDNSRSLSVLTTITQSARAEGTFDPFTNSSSFFRFYISLTNLIGCI